MARPGVRFFSKVEVYSVMLVRGLPMWWSFGPSDRENQFICRSISNSVLSHKKIIHSMKKNRFGGQR